MRGALERAKEGKDASYHQILEFARKRDMSGWGIPNKELDFTEINNFMNRAMIPYHMGRCAAFVIEKAGVEAMYKPGGVVYQQAKEHFYGLLEQQAKRSRK